MTHKMIPLAIALTLVFATGCQESAGETDRDVAQARMEAADENADAREDAREDTSGARDELARARDNYAEAEGDAREDLGEAEAGAMVAAAHARFEVMETEARGRHEIAKERCDGLNMGEDRDACQNEADGVLAVEESEAAKAREQALLAASRHD